MPIPEELLPILDGIYRKRPDLFTSEQSEDFRSQMSSMGMPLEKAEGDADFSLTRTIGQLVGGYIQGFTTIPVGGEPENTAEAIARNLGHLLGFVGFIPARTAFGKLSALGLSKLGSVTQKGNVLYDTWKAFQGGGRLTSFPVMIADKLTSQLWKAAEGSASFSALKMMQPGSLTRELTTGALHLGIASAVGAAPPWRIDVKERAQAFLGGAEAGAVFRGIGNLIGDGGISVGKAISTDYGMARDVNAVARAVSASLYMGLPATLRGEPFELQVFEYLAGGVFGGMEISRHQKKALEILHKYGGNDPRFPMRGLMDFEGRYRADERIPEYDKLSDETIAELQFQRDMFIGRPIPVEDLVPELQNVKVTEGGVILAQSMRDAVHRMYVDGKIDADKRDAYLYRIEWRERAEQILKERPEFNDDPEKFSEAIRKNFVENRESIEENINTKAMEMENYRSAVEFAKTVQTILGGVDPGALHEVTENNGISRSFNLSLVDLAEKIAIRRNTDATAEAVDLVQQIAGIRKKFTSPTGELDRPQFSTAGWDEYLSMLRTNKETDLDPKSDEYRGLRQIWLKVTENQQRPKIKINGSGKIVDAGEVDNLNLPIREMRPASDTEQRFDTRYLSTYELVREQIGPNGEPGPITRRDVEIHDMRNPFSLPRLAAIADEEGRGTLLSNKATGVIAMTRNMELPVKETDVKVDTKTGEERPKVDPVEFTEQDEANLAELQTTTKGLVSTQSRVQARFLSQSKDDWVNSIRSKNVTTAQTEKAAQQILEPLGLWDEFLAQWKTLKQKRSKPALGYLYDFISSQARPKLEKMIDDNRNAVYTQLIKQKQAGLYKEQVRQEQIRRELDLKGSVLISPENQQYVENWLGNKIESLDQVVDEKNAGSRTKLARFSKMYEAGKKAFIAAQENERTSREEPEYYGQMYDRLVANLIRKLELDMGGIPWEEQIRDGRFFKNADDRNKRAQVDLATEITYRGIPRVPGAQDGMRVVLARAVNKNGINQLEEADDLSYLTDKGLVKHDAHQDGPFYVRSDIYDSLMEYFGQDPLSDAQKGTFLHRDILGALYGKYAIHRADAGMDAEMQRMGIHGIMMDTAAKVSGKRKLYDVRVDKTGKLSFVDGDVIVDPEVTVAPWTAIRQNLTSGENLKNDMKPKRMIIQMASTLSDEQGAGAAIDAYTEIQNSIHLGDSVQNELVTQYYRYQDLSREYADPTDAKKYLDLRDQVLEKIDIERLGSRTITDIILGVRNIDDPLYTKIMKEILHIHSTLEEMGDQSVDFQVSDEGTLNDIIKMSKEIRKTSEAAQRMSKYMGIGPHLRIFIPEYIDQTLRGYLINRLVRPMVKESWKSVLQPYSWHIRQQTLRTLGRDIRPGEMLANEAVLAQETTYQNKKVTLGKLLDEWDAKRKLNIVDKELEAALEQVIVRSPTDSASSVRVVRIVGRTGKRGGGLTLHPEDMQYLGGADLDIDTVFAYRGLPKAMVEYYRSRAREWHTKDGKFLPQKEGGVAELLLEKPPKEYEERVKHPFSIADPLISLERGRSSAWAQQMVGQLVNHSRRLQIVYGFAKDLKSPIRTVMATKRVMKLAQLGVLNPITNEQGKLVKGTYVWTMAPRPTSITGRLGKRAALNMAVDGSPMKNAGDLLDTLTRFYFEEPKLRFYPKRGAPIDIEVKNTSALNIKEAPIYNSIWGIDKFMKGKDWYAKPRPKTYSMEQIRDGIAMNLKKLRGEINTLPIRNPWLRAGELIGQTPIKDNLLDTFGPNYMRLMELVSKTLNDRKDPEAAEILKTLGRQWLTVVGAKNTVKRTVPTRRRNPDGSYDLEWTFSPREIAGMRRKDIYDIVSSLVESHFYKNANIPSRMLEQIREVADIHSRKISARPEIEREMRRKKFMKKEFLSKSLNNSELFNTMYQFRMGLPSDSARRYYDARLVSSLMGTPKWKESEAGDLWKKWLDAKDKYQRGVENGASEEELETLRAKADNLSTLQEEAQAAWQKTIFNRQTWGLEFVDPTVLAKYGDTIKEVMGLSWKNGLTEADVRKMYKMSIKSPNIDVLMPEIMEERIDYQSINTAAPVKRLGIDKVNMLAQGELLGKVQPLADVKLRKDPQIEQLREDLSEIFYRYPDFATMIDSLFPGQVGQMRGTPWFGPQPVGSTLQDLRDFVNSFQRKGKWFWDISKDPKEVRWWHYWKWLDSIGKEHLPWDPQTLDFGRGWVVTPSGTNIETPTKILISHTGKIHNAWSEAHQIIDILHNMATAAWTEEWKSVRIFGDIALDAFAMAQRLREAGLANISNASIAKRYEKRAQESYEAFIKKWGKSKHKFAISDLKTGKYVTRDFSAWEIVEEYKRRSDEWAKYVYDEFIYNPEKDRLFLGRYEDNGGFLDWRRVVKEQIAPLLLEGRFAQMVAREGGVDALTYFKKMRDGTLTEKDAAPMISANKIFKQTPFTINALKRILHEAMLENLELPAQFKGPGRRKFGDIKDPLERREALNSIIARNPWVNYQPFGLDANNAKWTTEYFFPHTGYKREVVEQAWADTVAYIAGKNASGPEIIRMKMELEKLSTDSDDPGTILKTTNMNPDEYQDLIREHQIVNAGGNYIPSSLFSRNWDNMLEGWDETPDAMLSYEKSMIRTMGNLMGTIVSRDIIDSLRKVKPFGENTEAWVKFNQLFIRDNLGYPSTFPDAWLNSKELSIKQNPYYYLTDDFLVKVWKKFRAHLGQDTVEKDIDKPMEEVLALFRKQVGNNSLKSEYDLYKEFSEKMTAAGVREDQALARIKERALEELSASKFIRRLAHLSGLEAKWQVMSLLAHPKYVLANVMGGTQNDIISAGYAPFKNAGKFERLKILWPQLTGMDQWNRFVSERGALESFYTSEARFQGLFQVKNFGKFWDEVVGRVKTLGNGADIPKDSLLEMARRHGISTTVVEKVGSIVRGSERMIRQRSWTAHYMRARDILHAEVGGMELDHPWLVMMANRGVRGAQFLYNSSARPAFARTSLGKVFSRFQPWAWNSVRFRAEIYSDALQYGIRPGSAEFERFKRMAMADMFMIGLASLFPASLFGSSLPQPYDWLRNLSEYFFGEDDEARDRAFFGVVPYPFNIVQPLTPPVLGRVLPVFTGLLTGDWDRFANYTSWTFFPFGRFARDLNKTLQNPVMLMENMAGIPIHALQRQVTKERKGAVDKMFPEIQGGVTELLFGGPDSFEEPLEKK